MRPTITAVLLLALCGLSLGQEIEEEKELRLELKLDELGDVQKLLESLEGQLDAETLQKLAEALEGAAEGVEVFELDELLHEEGPTVRRRVMVAPDGRQRVIELHGEKPGVWLDRSELHSFELGDDGVHRRLRVLRPDAPHLLDEQVEELDFTILSDGSTHTMPAQTRTLRARLAAPHRHNADKDVLHFANGDVLSGRLAAAGEKTITFETDHGTLEVARDKIVSMEFAQPKPASGMGFRMLPQGEAVPFGRVIIPGEGDTPFGGMVVPVPEVAPPAPPAPPAVPVPDARPRAWLGIGLAIEDENGDVTVSIPSVADGGPAATAGIQAGDVLLSIAGTAINGYDDIVSVLSTRAPGDAVTVTVLRGDAQHAIEVTLGTRAP